MRKISNTLKKDWVILTIIVLGFVIGAYFYKSLPNKIPIHWNANGEANSYVNKIYGIFITPLIGLGIYILFLILPFIDPKRENYIKFNSTYQYLKYILIIFLFVIEIITILPPAGIINSQMIIKIIPSLLIILIGNVIGRFRHNYFVGIKTPWTLASEEVWTKTHRMAAPLWVIAGTVNIILSFTKINLNYIVPIIIIVLIGVIPIIYSYVIYHKIYK